MLFWLSLPWDSTPLPADNTLGFLLLSHEASILQSPLALEHSQKTKVPVLYALLQTLLPFIEWGGIPPSYVKPGDAPAWSSVPAGAAASVPWFYRML